MTKMSAKSRVRISQIIAQLKLALIEESDRGQLEAIQYGKKTLDLLEFDLLNKVSDTKQPPNTPGK